MAFDGLSKSARAALESEGGNFAPRLSVNCNVTWTCASLLCDDAHRRGFGCRRRLAAKIDVQSCSASILARSTSRTLSKSNPAAAAGAATSAKMRSMSCIIFFHCLKRSGFPTPIGVRSGPRVRSDNKYRKALGSCHSQVIHDRDGAESACFMRSLPV